MDLRTVEGLDRVRGLAAGLAATLGGAARAATTPAIERATLRLIGVGGLDRAGRPLAASVVDRAIGDDPGRLARGVLLPFVAALRLYESEPREIALDVASGTIDLDLEADALVDPARRDDVTSAARDLVAAALARIEANRTARLDLIEVLGDPPIPRLGVPMRSPLLDRAASEAATLVSGGADVVVIDVPASRELADRLSDPADPADIGLSTPREPRIDGEIPPAGSQRALAEIRIAVDAASAERRSYARIALAPRSLSAAETAVVAGFERLDALLADPMSEIVVDGVDPARALADHSFARRILRRAGGRLYVSPGPLVVAPDLAAGAPATAVVRAGRALALQALSIELARGDGFDDAGILVGALPEWILDERSAASIALATVAAQRLLFPGLGLGLAEPTSNGSVRDRWWQVRSLVCAVGGDPDSIQRDADVDTVAAAAAENRTASETIGRLVADAGRPVFGHGLDEVVAQVAAAAVSTLEGLAASGWDAVLGTGAENGSLLAAGTTTARGDAPDVAAIAASTIVG
jgi:hypothetical protein